ncbi:undecaprenyl-diphosphatase UppP [Candidatus Kaiserbacteria bacterium]|nr:undecaprenyl-diphosphatase UppP [Candidatus Kaiserbacteria bacterium]
MDIIHAIALGVVEGITEFLPVSSTGHLILATRALGIPESTFTKSFDITIQLGAIASVVVLYWRRFLDVSLLKKLVVGFIPTGVIGLAFYGVVKTYLLGNAVVVVAALALGGVLLIAFERWHTEGSDATVDVSAISYKQAALVGVFQSIAIVPGVSRSAATILGGLWLGLSRRAIVEFSFLLAVPTMLAASTLDLLKNYQSFSADQAGVLAVGFLVSFVVALGAITWLLRFVQRHDFAAFGYYRIAVALAFVLMVA